MLRPYLVVSVFVFRKKNTAMKNMRSLHFFASIFIFFGFMPNSAIASPQNSSADFSNAQWQTVPDTGTAPIYIDMNGLQLDESQHLITYDLINSDDSYSRIETDCVNHKQRAIRQGWFESKTKASFVSLPNARWQSIEADSLNATLSDFVCSLGNRIEPATEEAFYKAKQRLLEQIVEGCEDNQKTQDNITYQICTIDGEPVQASEAIPEGDGIGFWFENNKVRAIRFFHSGDLAFFDDNGKLEVVFSVYEGKMQTNVTATEKKELEETAKNGYRSIFEKFKI
jgi:hypothetical protein